MPKPTTLAELPLPERSGTSPAAPPPRFAEVTFESYQPANDSQSRACQESRAFVRQFVASSGGAEPPSLLHRLIRFSGKRRESSPNDRGLYLDGGYGVGKTHLLAAAYHAAEGVPRAYLTFQELVHRIGALGMSAAVARIDGPQLLCLDEFELDDPGNTLIVKRYLERLFSAGGAVLTTSNTPPEAQGQGRFNAEDFRREIQGIASHFRVIRVEGRDYRRRSGFTRLLAQEELTRLSRSAPSGSVSGRLEELLSLLRTLHPVRYGGLMEEFGTLLLSDVATIADQNDALRFVHFVDWLYNSRKGLLAAGSISLDDLFAASYRTGAYSRKYDRCLSRLSELMSESASALSARSARASDAAD